MKSLTMVVLLAVMFGLFANAQITECPMLILKEKKEVVAYFEMLNSLKSNPYHKIVKTLNVQGDEILTCEFGLSEESVYGMLGISAVFHKFGDVNLCVQQLISGRAEHSDMVLSYFKKTFKMKENGIYENAELVNTWRQKKIFAKINADESGKTYGLVFSLEGDK